jgi:hypothetical protein
MNGNLKRWTLGSAALLACLFFSTGAYAFNGGGGGSEFAGLYDDASGDGSCSVNRGSTASSNYNIASEGSGECDVLSEGNGAGGNSRASATLLESVASHCIAVAAANTANAGDGTDMRSALNGIRARYGSILGDKVCTAGHSQGGGGSFNAANLIGADCVIPVQPDTRFTTRIRSDLASHVEVITLWGENDTLAPASGNRRNVEGASTILTQVETEGEGHFAPASGRGGRIGVMFRMANIAQLSNDPAEASRFRQAFWGPTTDYTVTTANSNISDVRRNAAAEATAP